MPKITKEQKSIIRNSSGTPRRYGDKKMPSMSKSRKRVHFLEKTHSKNIEKSRRRGNMTFRAKMRYNKIKSIRRKQRSFLRSNEKNYLSGKRGDVNIDGLKRSQSAALQGYTVNSGPKYTDQAWYFASKGNYGRGKKKRKKKKSKKAKKQKKAKKTKKSKEKTKNKH